MPLATYEGMGLVPGMGSPSYSAEHDLMGLIYGSPHHCEYLTYAVIDGASRDAGNTGFTTVLRPGLVMAQVTATKKWKPFVNGASDGTELPIGILTQLGLSTQMDASNTDKFMATILIRGIINPEALCINTTAAYGLDKVTAAHIEVRKGLRYNFLLSDDFAGYVHTPMAKRTIA